MPTLNTAPIPEIALHGNLIEAITGSHRVAFEAILPQFLARQRWFGGKNRQIRDFVVQDVIPMPAGPEPREESADNPLSIALTLLQVRYQESEPEVYVIPLAVARGLEGAGYLHELPHAVVACIAGGGTDVLFDAIWDPSFRTALLAGMAQETSHAGQNGQLTAVALVNLADETTLGPLPTSVSKGEQSNTSVVYGDRYFLKLFRRLEYGVNPDLEISRYLVEKKGFSHIPTPAGYLEYQRSNVEPMTIAFLQRLAPNQNTGWQYTVDALEQFLKEIRTSTEPVLAPADIRMRFTQLEQRELPEHLRGTLGPYLESVRCLGRRTAEMHRALASETLDPAFTPEPFSTTYQRSIYLSMCDEASRVFQMLDLCLHNLPGTVRDLGRRVLNLQSKVQARFQAVAALQMTGLRCRVHGDFHLGQVLFTGTDFILLDFEGEPLRSIAERRIKRSVIRDVAGMVRSFHYAAYSTEPRRDTQCGAAHATIHLEDVDKINLWVRQWYLWVTASFLHAYRTAAGQAAFLPATDTEYHILLEAFTLSKAVYELGYELGHRPDWTAIPLQGILDLTYED